MTQRYISSPFWYLLLYLLAGKCLSSTAQTVSVAGAVSTIGQIIPPAPKTAALGTFGQLPVDLNAGAVSVTVPLVELHSGPLRLPVTLSYSTTGIKVAQVPSWVGQGWNLPVGGVITRTVRGRPDEDDLGYNTKWQLWRQADSLAAANVPGAAARKHNLDRLAYDQNWDLEADTYNVSAPGLSATLTCLGYGRALLSPDQGWQVLKGGPQTNGWELSAPDGTRYYFYQPEVSETEDVTGRHSFTAAWHLTAIESADSHYRIDLEYISDGDAIQVNLPQVTQVKIVLPGTSLESGPCASCLKDPPSAGQLGSVYQPVTPVWSHTVSLRQIRSATQRIVFSSDLLTQKIAPGQWPLDPPARILRYAQLFALHGDGLPARTFRFSYRYASSSDASADSVTEAGRFFLLAAGEAGKPATRFTYQNSSALPAIHSFSQDHWGYYNQAINRSLVPQLPLNYKYTFFEGGDRSTHPTAQLAGSLSSVTYPTGGSTYFTYEANQVAAANVFDVDNPTTAEQRLTSQAIANGSTYLDSLSQHVYDVVYSGGYTGLGKPYVNATLIKLPDGARSLAWRLDYREPTRSGSPGADFSTAPQVQRFVRLDPAATDPVADALAGPGIYPSAQPLTLQAGTYMLLAIAFDSTARAEITVSLLPHLEAPVAGAHTVGGLRIRRMVDFPSLGGDSLVTTYDYTMPDPGTGKPVTSGVLFDIPIYIRGTPCGALIVSARDNTVLPRVGAEGYHMGYARVVTTRQHGATAGSTVTTYLNAAEPTLRSLVTSETHLDGTGRVVQDSQTDYFASAAVEIPSAKLQLYSFETVTMGDPGGGCVNIVKDTLFNSPLYFFSPTQIRTVRIQQRQYGTAAGLIHETVTYNKYQPDIYGRFRPLPTETAQVTSGGDTTLLRRQYTADIDTTRLTAAANSAAKGVAALVARGVTSAVVEERHGRATTQGRQWLSGTWTEYTAAQKPARQWTLRTAHPLSAAALPQVSIAGNSFAPPTGYQPVLNYDRYSERGELLQMHPSSGLPTSLLWGDHTPIAEAVNMPTGVGASTSFEPRSYGGWLCDSGASSTHLVSGGRTGRWAYYLTGTAPVRSTVQPPHTYELLYWAQGGTPTLYQNQLPLTPLSLVVIATAPDGWHQDRLRVRLDKPAILALDGTNVLLDELRLYWVEARLTSYTYDPLFGTVTSQTDPTGRTVTYEYDALGRLVRTRDEQGRILSQQQYHYVGTK